MESHTSSSSALSADPEEARVPQVLQVGMDWYRDLVDHSQDLLCIHDLQGRLLSVNPAPARVLGYTVEEILRISMRDLIVPEFREQFDAYLDEIQRKGESHGFMAVLTRFGEHRIWQYQNTLRTEGVPIPVVRGMAHDVTEQKQAERALRTSEARLRTIFEKSPIGVCLIETQTGRFQKANPKFCEIVGRCKEDLLHCDARNIFPSGDLPEAMEQIDPPFHEGPTVEGERRVLRPDGSTRWVKMLVAPMAAEQIGSHMAIVQDTTESRQADIALRQSEARLRVALKNSALVVFHQDRELRYTWLHNPVLAWAEQDVIGKTDIEIVGEQVATRLTAIKKNVLETGVGARVEVPIPHGGKQHYVDFTIEPLTDSAGLVTGLTCAATDVTPLRELSQELRQAQEKLMEEKFYLEKEIDTELGFDEIIGKSEVLKTVLAQVIRVASSDSAVLLLGESGTGKELIARAVHRMSKRSKYPFIKMNCAAIPSGLLESELFGHERGAFTGAVTKKIGRLELADKGTLFLDEIGEVPPELQPKLLRVLQDQEFERLGGTDTLKVNFRLIAATNRDLVREVQEKRFRSDLYYRLSVFPVRIPPLRARRGDIPLLAEHFVRKHAQRMNKLINRIPKKVIDALLHWNWPGNVRELENFMERSVILTSGPVLAAPISELIVEESVIKKTLEAVEREHILAALEESQGQLSGPRGAAIRLGLPRTTLQSKLKQMGVDLRKYRAG